MAIGIGAIGVVGSTLMLSVSMKVAQVAAILIALIFMSLSTIQPLYGMIVVGAGLTAGGWAAYYGLNLIFENIFRHAHQHWSHANHIANQAHQFELRKIELLTNNNSA